MKTFVKLDCPDEEEKRSKAIRTLEKMAYMTPEVCIMDASIIDKIPSAYQLGTMSAQGMTDWAVGYFGEIEDIDIRTDRCSKIISKSGEELGEYDFMFEWFEKPEKAQVEKLERDIVEALKPLGCKAEIVNRE